MLFPQFTLLYTYFTHHWRGLENGNCIYRMRWLKTVRLHTQFSMKMGRHCCIVTALKQSHHTIVQYYKDKSGLWHIVYCIFFLIFRSLDFSFYLSELCWCMGHSTTHTCDVRNKIHFIVKSWPKSHLTNVPLYCATSVNQLWISCGYFTILYIDWTILGLIKILCNYSRR